MHFCVRICTKQYMQYGYCESNNQEDIEVESCLLQTQTHPCALPLPTRVLHLHYPSLIAISPLVIMSNAVKHLMGLEVREVEAD